MAKLLLVEDDAALAESVVQLLDFDGHRVESAFDGKSGLELLALSGYDLVILDWELPGCSGVELCARYRAMGGKAPVLMLTHRSRPLDKVTGLDAGANDYLPKPFDPSELRARVRALLRRSTHLFDPTKVTGRISLNCDGASTVQIDDRIVKLNKREYELLEFLLRHPGSYFSAEQLIQQVWHSTADISEEAIRICVSRLRKKLDFPGDPSVVETFKGWGYKIADCYLKAERSTT